MSSKQFYSHMDAKTSTIPSKLPYAYMNDTSINPYLLCYVCNNPLIDPVKTDDNRPGCRLCLINASSVTPITERIVLEMLNDLLVKCLQCEETHIRRGDFEQHEQIVCKRAVVRCRAADIKCPWKDQRALLDEHMRECVYEPLRPALHEIITENKQLQERINKLETLVKQLQ